MAADGHDFHFANDNAAPDFRGLEGIDDLVASRGLEILRERTEPDGMRALLELASIVAAHDLAQKDLA